MTFKSPIWYPIAVVLSVLNLVGVGYAVALTEAGHAAGHVAVAAAFGLWAQHLRRRSRGTELHAAPEVLDALDAFDAELSKLRLELTEVQERLDFTERMLAQGSEARRVGGQS